MKVGGGGGGYPNFRPHWGLREGLDGECAKLKSGTFTKQMYTECWSSVAREETKKIWDTKQFIIGIFFRKSFMLHHNYNKTKNMEHNKRVSLKEDVYRLTDWLVITFI